MPPISACGSNRRQLHIPKCIPKSRLPPVRGCNFNLASVCHDLGEVRVGVQIMKLKPTWKKVQPNEWGWGGREDSHWPRYCSSHLGYFLESWQQPCEGHPSHFVHGKDWEVRWLQQDHLTSVWQISSYSPRLSDSRPYSFHFIFDFSYRWFFLLFSLFWVSELSCLQVQSVPFNILRLRTNICWALRDRRAGLWRMSSWSIQWVQTSVMRQVKGWKSWHSGETVLSPKP